MVEIHIKKGESIQVWHDDKNVSDIVVKIACDRKGNVKFIDKRY
jgi:hypothetical protein